MCRGIRSKLTLGQLGQGPGEFVGTSMLDAYPPASSKFWVYDVTLRRLTSFDLDSALSFPSYTHGKIINIISEIGPPFYLLWLSDSALISTGAFSIDGRIAFFNNFGQFLKFSGKIPPGRKKNTPPSVHLHAYHSKLKAKPDRSQFLLATLYADQLDIFDNVGRRKSTVKGPISFEPDYKVVQAAGSPTMTYGKNMRFGYIDIETTNNYIYSLFSGEFHRKSKNANFGNFIYVFDWNGNPIRSYKLDYFAISIAVDERKNMLYAIRHSPYPSIVYFSLKK